MMMMMMLLSGWRSTAECWMLQATAAVLLVPGECALEKVLVCSPMVEQCKSLLLDTVASAASTLEQATW